MKEREYLLSLYEIYSNLLTDKEKSYLNYSLKSSKYRYKK